MPWTRRSPHRIILTASLIVLIWLSAVNRPVAARDDALSEPDHAAMFDCSAVENFPVAECQALVEFYAATGGSSTWLNQNGWLEHASPCAWGGVNCSADRHVIVLIRSNNNLSGTLPEDLFYNLPELRRLDLAGNDLSGPIPGSISALENLHTLYLHDNAFSGLIPEGLLGDTDSTIAQLFLDGNNLTGMLPVDLGDPMVQSVDFSDNPNLVGPIPRAYMELSNLANLFVDRTNVCARTDVEFQTWAESVFDLRLSGRICSPNDLDPGVYLLPDGDGVEFCIDNGRHARQIADANAAADCVPVDDPYLLDPSPSGSESVRISAGIERLRRARLVAQCKENTLRQFVELIGQFVDALMYEAMFEAIDEDEEGLLVDTNPEVLANARANLIIAMLDRLNSCEQTGGEEVNAAQPTADLPVMRIQLEDTGGILHKKSRDYVLEVDTPSLTITQTTEGPFDITTVDDVVVIVNMGTRLTIEHKSSGDPPLALRSGEYMVADGEQMSSVHKFERLFLPVIAGP